MTDISDFAKLAANFNQTLAADPARSAVPEPAALVVSAAAGMAAMIRRRRAGR
jgi:hypothetical protein